MEHENRDTSGANAQPGASNRIRAHHGGLGTVQTNSIFPGGSTRWAPPRTTAILAASFGVLPKEGAPTLGAVLDPKGACTRKNKINGLLCPIVYGTSRSHFQGENTERIDSHLPFRRRPYSIWVSLLFIFFIPGFLATDRGDAHGPLLWDLNGKKHHFGGSSKAAPQMFFRGQIHGRT